MNNFLDLVPLAQQGDEQAMEVLLKTYKPKVTAICREYFLVGAAFDDLIQEGMIGLYKAIKAYDGKISFNAFSSLCIHRQLQTAVKNANRKKNSPLNQYLPINYEDNDEDEESSNIVLVDDTSDIEQNYIDKEMHAIVISKVKDLLTEEQFKLLKLFLRGDSYSKISDTLNIPIKKVDNLLQSIKKKLHTLKGEI